MTLLALQPNRSTFNSIWNFGSSAALGELSTTIIEDEEDDEEGRRKQSVKFIGDLLIRGSEGVSNDFVNPYKDFLSLTGASTSDVRRRTTA